ncbi:MAG TPA: cytochrome c oxidase subunit 3 family protein [Terriglobales bacterium]|nr:cytochrome c oxidase subunit 3 family protein [Terriglobales bacterium]
MSDVRPTGVARYVAHHFDDAEQQQQTVTLGMWLFLVNEIMFFGGLFLVYTVYRSAFPEAFAAASHHLDIQLGTINTAVLIGSSLTMALAVHAAQLGHRGQLQLFLILTIVLGSIFLGIKGVEYSHKFHELHVPGALFEWHENPGFAGGAELFFGLYFIMTGMHALHMVIGIVILAILVRNSYRGDYGPHYFTPVEMTGLYWHFVDIVWIFLFPLLYLIGRH